MGDDGAVPVSIKTCFAGILCCDLFASKFQYFVCCWNSIFFWSLKNSTNKYRRRQNGATEKTYIHIISKSPKKIKIYKLKYSEPKKNDNLSREKKNKYKIYKTYKKRQIAFNVPLKFYIPTYICRSIFYVRICVLWKQMELKDIFIYLVLVTFEQHIYNKTCFAWIIIYVYLWCSFNDGSRCCPRGINVDNLFQNWYFYNLRL